MATIACICGMGATSLSEITRLFGHRSNLKTLQKFWLFLGRVDGIT